MDIRKAPDEAQVIRDHRRDLRLLQHDLGDPDAICVTRSLPREIVAPVARLPTRYAHCERGCPHPRSLLAPSVHGALAGWARQRFARAVRADAQARRILVLRGTSEQAASDRAEQESADSATKHRGEGEQRTQPADDSARGVLL